MATLAERIAELEAILDSGLKSAVIGGQRVEYDHATIRRRLAELRQEQLATRRPRAASIDLSGF